MSFGKIILILLISCGAGLMVIGGCFYSGYNTAVGLDETVTSKWAQVENQLQRRFDLIDNLVGTVKGVAGHEKEVFLGLANARKSYFQADSTGAKAKAAGVFQSALSRLLVLKETYPELKANESFMKLQDSIEGTENRLATERRRYNEAVKVLNTFTRKLLGRLYASMAGVEKAEYFEISEAAKAVPKVDFSTNSGG